MTKKLFISIFFILLLVNLIYAVQPTVLVPTASQGIVIEHPINEIMKVNTDHKFHFHLFNYSSGLPFLNSSSIVCIFHLYDIYGSHLIKNTKVLSDDTYDWEALVKAGNFTQSGQYAYVFQCNNSVIGGFYANSFQITPTGQEFTMVWMYGYIFFLLLCCVLVFFSFRLCINNSIAKDSMEKADMYKMKKRNEFLYYMALLKKKLWIVGVFGIYLSILLFMAILNQMVYNLGLSDLNTILINLVVVMSWGLIPFTIFWIVYLIIVFWKSTTEIMRYQFGALGRSSQ
jgi:hypothetical protein